MPETAGATPYQIIRDNQRLSIVLPDEKLLDQTGYKVLHSVAGSNLLCGYKSLFNGHIKLTYDISECTPLPAMYQTLTAEQALGVLGELMNTLEQIYDIGFLQYENISLHPEDIFLDSNSYQVFLIYIPVRTGRKAMGRAEFEQAFRACLLDLLGRIPAAERLRALREALASGQAMAEIRERLQSGEFFSAPAPAPEPAPPAPEPERRPGVGERLRGLFRRERKERGRPETPTPAPPAAGQRWLLVGVDTPEPVELHLTGEQFVVGRSSQSAQGVVGFNRTIGREHCRFSLRGEHCYLEDLDSANGTFLNDIRLTPGKHYEAVPGDRIRLSNSSFELRRE